MKTQYSIRNGGFHVNDELVPVDPRVVRTALVSHRIETGCQLDPQSTILPEAVARRILRMERARSISSLSAELFRLERAEAA